MADMETLVKEQINVVANLIRTGGPGVHQEVANFMFDMAGNLPMLREDRGEVERFLIDCFVDLDTVWKYMKSMEHRMALVDPPRGARPGRGRPPQVRLRAVADLVLLPVFRPQGTPEEWVEGYVSRCFMEFIQGITLFEEDLEPGEVLGWPVYHRRASCGPNLRNQADQLVYQRANLDCSTLGQVSLDSPDTVRELARRARNSMNCYVERLIYDHMWEHTHTDKQNFGHQLALVNTERRLFESCHYPVATMITSTGVHFGDHAIPLVLRISYLHGQVTANEVYTRTRVGAAYTTEVACIRTEHDPATGVIRNTRWTQNYHNKTPRRFAGNNASIADASASSSMASGASVTAGGRGGSGDTATTIIYPNDEVRKLPCKHFNTCSHTSTGKNHRNKVF